jgi:hypothetical protein
MSNSQQLDASVLVPLILSGLQGSATRKMVRLAVDFLLRQPLQSIVPLSLVHRQTLMILGNIVESEQTQVWLVEQIKQAQASVPDGTPGDFVPSEIQQPLRNALSQHVEIDTDLVHQLMNHPTMEQLFHDVLASVLLDFTETIKTWTQTATSMTSSMGPKGVSSGFGRLKRLSEKVVQNSPLGQITQLIEQQAQQKILQFLDQSIASIIRRSAVEIGKPEHQSQQAAYRLHVLDVLLSTDNQRLVDQLTVLSPELLVETGVQTVRAFLDLPTFQAQILLVLQQFLDSVGEQSVYDFLEASNLGDDWRDEVEEYVTEIALQVIAEPQFAAILTEMLSGEIEATEVDDR